MASVLFIDNPVGTGYSYVTSDSAFTKDVNQIAQDLMTTITAFLDQLPDFQVEELVLLVIFFYIYTILFLYCLVETYKEHIICFLFNWPFFLKLFQIGEFLKHLLVSTVHVLQQGLATGQLWAHQMLLLFCKKDSACLANYVCYI